ncbi:Acetyl-Coa Carboxylase 2 [Manis pentadactyla]|nr:Acetyl-Coa Carboxylase 2 [Manis pentadactyla]
MTDVAADGVSSGDISADAERPDVEVDVVCSGDINADVMFRLIDPVRNVAADGASSGMTSADALNVQGMFEIEVQDYGGSKPDANGYEKGQALRVMARLRIEGHSALQKG